MRDCHACMSLEYLTVLASFGIFCLLGWHLDTGAVMCLVLWNFQYHLSCRSALKLTDFSLMLNNIVRYYQIRCEFCEPLQTNNTL